jgi:CubicO group peptidase (beta-lactamase class C family)
MERLLIPTIFILAISANAVGQGLSAIADSIRHSSSIPALGYAVFRSDTILELEVLGLKRNDRGERADRASRFHLGSNTKAITAFIAAKLVEEGKIHWSTRFFDLYPALEANARADYAAVTLQDLLAHRAGVQPFTDGKEFKKLKLEGVGEEGDDIRFARYLLARPPQKPKGGEQSVYSNAGYALAAMMLEQAAQDSYAGLVEQFMNKQLALGAQFGWPHWADSSQVYGHQGKSWGHKTLRPLTGNDGYVINGLIAPAGDMNMTLPDYVRFLQLHLQGLNGTSGVLSGETCRHLLFGLPDYALGWGNGLSKDRQIASHDGSGGTFYCHAVLIEPWGLGIALVANTAEEASVEGLYALRQAILQAYRP